MRAFSFEREPGFECDDAHAPKPTPKEPAGINETRKEATLCKGKELRGVGRTGLEHLAKPTGKTSDPKAGGAESGAVGDETGPIDIDLRRLIDRWPGLPEVIRKAIMALVETTDQEQRLSS